MTTSEREADAVLVIEAPDGDFDPMVPYFMHMEDKDGSVEDLEVVGSDHAVTIHSIGAARFLARGMTDLGQALGEQPHSLLLAEDATIVIEALAAQLRGAAAIAAGVGTWLTQAHTRGEVGDPAEALATLSELATAIGHAAEQATTVTVPDDTAELFDRDSLAELVTAELRQRGLDAGDPTVFDSQIVWDDLPGGHTLYVNEDGWQLLAPTEDPDRWNPLMEPRLPGLPYAHPAQVATIVAEFFAS